MLEQEVPNERPDSRLTRGLAVFVPFQVALAALVIGAFWDSEANRLALTIWLGFLPVAVSYFLVAIICRPDTSLASARVGRWCYVLHIAALAWTVGDAGASSSGSLFLVIAMMALTVTVSLQALASGEIDSETNWMVLVPVASATLSFVVQGSGWTALLLTSCVVLLLTQLHFGHIRHREVIDWAEARQRSALSDSLTGLLNRDGFLKLLEERSDEDCGGAVAMVDLDRFKIVNDAYGHATGDAVLRTVADRLRTLLPNARVGRLGGDEFGVLFEPPVDAKTASDVVTATLRSVEAPIQTAQARVTIRASAGVTAIRPGTGPEVLMAEADVSMYDSKRRGGRRVTAFGDLQNQPLKLARLEQQVREALEEGEIVFDLQPIVSCSDGYPVTTELLARWPQADGTTVPPSVFVPIIREAGLGGALANLALKTANELFERWRADPMLCGLGININVEAEDLQEQLDQLIETLIDPTFRVRFGIEFVESSFVDLSHDALALLANIGESGVRIFLDDFGTGQSSLSQLRTLPITNLKIDQSFILDCDHDPIKQELLRLISQMAASLFISIVAEGVETPEEWAFLKSINIRAVQGFYVGEPIPAASCEDALRALFAKSQWPEIDLILPRDGKQISRRDKRFAMLGWNPPVSVAQEQDWP